MLPPAVVPARLVVCPLGDVIGGRRGWRWELWRSLEQLRDNLHRGITVRVTRPAYTVPPSISSSIQSPSQSLTQLKQLGTRVLLHISEEASLGTGSDHLSWRSFIIRCTVPINTNSLNTKSRTTTLAHSARLPDIQTNCAGCVVNRCRPNCPCASVDMQMPFGPSICKMRWS